MTIVYVICSLFNLSPSQLCDLHVDTFFDTFQGSIFVYFHTASINKEKLRLEGMLCICHVSKRHMAPAGAFQTILMLQNIDGKGCTVLRIGTQAFTVMLLYGTIKKGN